LKVYINNIIKMSSAKLQQKLLTLQQRAGDHLHQLLQLRPLLRGCFSRVYTRCGKPNCWCAHRAKGHPHARLTWSENGQLTTRKVPPPALDQVQTFTDNYRKFRSLRRQLLSLHAQLQAILDRYEESLILQARKPLKSVGFTSKMSARTDRKRQTGHRVKNEDLP
jgi:hypothetical protein